MTIIRRAIYHEWRLIMNDDLCITKKVRKFVGAPLVKFEQSRTNIELRSVFSYIVNSVRRLALKQECVVERERERERRQKISVVDARIFKCWRIGRSRPIVTFCGTRLVFFLRISNSKNEGRERARFRVFR